MEFASFVIPAAVSEFDVLKCLHPRMTLSATEKTKYNHLHKGWEGEQRFSTLLKKHLPSRYFVLTDVLIGQSETEFQLDVLVIADDTIYPLEVKNFDGDYVIHNDRWHAVPSQREIRNPLHQVSRMEVLLRNVLNQGKFNFAIESKIVFSHPEFYLYQAPLGGPLVFPTQINRFIEELSGKPFQKNAHQEKLVHFLTKQQKSWSTYTRLPKYTFEELKKGIICQDCPTFLHIDTLRQLVCHHCGKREKLEHALLRSVQEYHMLFPDRRITVNDIHKWCRVIPSRRAIRRLLKKHLRLVLKGRFSYYEFEEVVNEHQ